MKYCSLSPTAERGVQHEHRDYVGTRPSATSCDDVRTKKINCVLGDRWCVERFPHLLLRECLVDKVDFPMLLEFLGSSVISTIITKLFRNKRDIYQQMPNVERCSQRGQSHSHHLLICLVLYMLSAFDWIRLYVLTAAAVTPAIRS